MVPGPMEVRLDGSTVNILSVELSLISTAFSFARLA